MTIAPLARGRVLGYPSAEADRLEAALLGTLEQGGFCTQVVAGYPRWDCRSPRLEAARAAARRGLRIERAFLLPDPDLEDHPTLREQVELDRSAGIETRVVDVQPLVPRLAASAPGTLEFGLWDERICAVTLPGAGQWRLSTREEDLSRARAAIGILTTGGPAARADGEIPEPLLLSARLARQAADELCYRDPSTGESCAWYHGAKQYLRIIGLQRSLGSDGPYLVDAFRRVAREGGFRRVLISGTADYGMLARLLFAYRAEGAGVDVTVADRCETPLLLNRWYADRFSTTITTRSCDLLRLEEAAPFDLVTSHFFLEQFDPGDQRALVARWRALLRPGGKVITAVRVRPPLAPQWSRRTPQQARAFVKRAYRAAQQWGDLLGADPGELARLAHGYARRRTSRASLPLDAIERLFKDAGFALDRFELAGRAAPSPADRPSWPAPPGGVPRARVVATRRS